MPSEKQLDPTGERAEATKAMESTPISGKDHEYRADGDHRPSQRVATVEGGKADAGIIEGTAPEVGVETERHISEGIPGAGTSPQANSMPEAPRDRESNV
jgi:hypothetical protein